VKYIRVCCAQAVHEHENSTAALRGGTNPRWQLATSNHMPTCQAKGRKDGGEEEVAT